ncbi:hypothetical protein [Rickettsia prowazekii]|uniref:Uncharacterized protein RP088 n=2 Tax=Rickettsia prowazekii TaxID=782 RepID=Y088_RICPR|nr:hypothetical protein [Rickettsia prowazekii]Q9ZE59.1 RecName: Full=Uncharacterized protein RP088; Flags: Precursor [Rickettsia prowazekii str. Madrid E]EOB10083.1 hypothetical protein H376_2310 [Rickettsia prowazekii str. GvF12]ADE29595.1 conserved hypothetical protein [Rickettsia prowazekii str. Rp22]AFE48912.1 hypothetical protein M9W_00415 [Rickettsia prowazekii str. Chernikova]AFE49757.1 hypothetical protein M9Y_00415 [Rickettsia prowazekii str. Katsinyian]AFE50601.1 hypothetical prote
MIASIWYAELGCASAIAFIFPLIFCVKLDYKCIGIFIINSLHDQYYKPDIMLERAIIIA